MGCRLKGDKVLENLKINGQLPKNTKGNLEMCTKVRQMTTSTID